MLEKERIVFDGKQKDNGVPEAFKKFRYKPKTRLKFRYIGKNGEALLDEEIEKNKLNKVQGEHLKSKLVRNQILNGVLKLEDAVSRTEKFPNLDKLLLKEIEGIEIGLLYSQVNNLWFTSEHAKLINERAFTYDEIKGLGEYHNDYLRRNFTL